MDTTNIELANTYKAQIAQLQTAKTNINANFLIYFSILDASGNPIYIPRVGEKLHTHGDGANDYETASNDYKTAIVAAIDAEIAALQDDIEALPCVTA